MDDFTKLLLIVVGVALLLTPGVMGTPEVKILSVPSNESTQNWISGVVDGISPADYGVVVYIKVGSVWWGPKPTFASPLTSIRSDGFWDTNFVTGGYDDEATEFAAYLIPRDEVQQGVVPPELRGTSSLPSSLAGYPHSIKSRPSSTPSSATQIRREGTDLVGLSFSPYLNGEQPGITSLSEETIRHRLSIIAANTTWIRTFGVDGGLEYVGPIAHSLGKKTAVGAWLGPDLAANKVQLQSLVRIGREGGADILIVGSETLLRGDLSDRALITYMQWVRDQVPGVPVATADTYTELQTHPAVIEASDLLLVNIYPYWEGVSIDNAVSRSRAAYLGVKNVANGRPVVISEMGWPDAGSTRGQAVASTANAIRYLREVTNWTNSEGIPYFYFEAFDEAWKATSTEGSVGAHWGIWDGNLQLKPGRLPLNQDLEARFSATPTTGSAPLNVQFTDTTTGSPSSWYWSFGDGSTSSAQNPSHLYSSAGTYTVQLQATNSVSGKTSIKLMTITITPGILTADFQVMNAAGSNQVRIIDTSVNASTVRYDLGDGASSRNIAANGPTLSYYYVTAGTYTITQTVTSATGQTATKQVTVTIGGALQTLQAAFTVNTQTVQSGQSVIGTDASTGSPASWSWNFGDGYAASTRTINHIYTAAGSYTLSLTVTSGSQTSTTSKTITVTNPIVILPGQPYNGPHNAPGTVQAEDYDLGGQNVAYYDTTSGNTGGAYRTDDVDIEAGASGLDVGWIIGGEYFTYSVDAATAGDYPIILRAANPDGIAKTVTVSTSSSSTTVNVASTGSFDIYNSFTSAGTLSFAAGRNVIKVTFGASRMNFDSFTIGTGTPPITTITTQPATGVASFTASPTSGKKSLTVALTDTTTGGNPASWKWNCGNGQTFTGKSVGLNRIWYNNAGTYTITLTVTDQDGSTRTATKTITVTS